jgi:KaiC/GvpD/RAD55 family RecA-like ATPase
MSLAPIDPYAPIPPTGAVNGGAHEPPAGFYDDEPMAEPYSAYKVTERRGPPAPARPVTPPELARAWGVEGQLVRVATGFRTLDEACRGGLPVPWRVVIIGAPSAGKTALLMVLAQRLGTDGGLCVGVVGVDEEPDDLNVRLAQMAGFTIAQCEGRDPAVLERMAEALAAVRVRFYDGSHTVEGAADDVAAWAAQEGLRSALVIDSLQTVRCAASAEATSAREAVDANLRAIRAKGAQHRMLMVATSEANRGSYRDDDAAETSNDMAAGKESGSIEFSAQTLIMVRTPKGHADHVSVRVPKNRRGARAGFEFFLRLDRDRHALSECGDPKADPEQATQTAAKERTRNRSLVDADAVVLASVVRARPGIGEVELRGAIRALGHRWGVDRLNGARELLKAGRKAERLVDRGQGKGCLWHLEQTAPVGGP